MSEISYEFEIIKMKVWSDVYAAAVIASRNDPSGVAGTAVFYFEKKFSDTHREALEATKEQA